MKEVRDLKAGDVVRFDYGIDNRVEGTVMSVEVHPTWTKMTAVIRLPEGTTRKLTTWLYTNALIEVVG